MNHDTKTQIAGILIALGALALLGGFLAHPPEVADPAAQAAIIAGSEGAWRASHALLGLGAALFAVAALGARSRAGTAAAFGHAMIVIGAAPALLLFLIEATVAPDVAVSGDLAAFAQWGSLAVGLVATLPIFFLGQALVAFGDRGATPRPVAVVAGVLAVVGVVGGVGPVYGLPPALGVLFFALFPVQLWYVAYGVGLVRGKGAEPTTGSPTAA
ncbi:MAG TPA: hypothetical protein VI997_10965 [Candidatus Thermoplasmatota archaeon]|nr:hypothetical protein [Candidatus Thermoplasmatota archaeon]